MNKKMLIPNNAVLDETLEQIVQNLTLPDKLKERLKNTAVSATVETSSFLRHYLEEESVVQVGIVPVELRPLYILHQQLDAERRTEEHRRCVEILGREEYDNESVEFMVWNQVGEDPNFNSARTVQSILHRELKVHFPHLRLDLMQSPRYYIGAGWEIYEPKPQEKKFTPEEIRARELLREIYRT